MEQYAENSQPQNHLEDLIKEQSLHIFDEENWIKKDLRKLAEVTYSYDKTTWINTTLFVKWWWLNLRLYKKSCKETKRKLLLEAKNNLINLLNEKKSQIKNTTNNLILFESFWEKSIESNLKSIFYEALLEKENFLDYSLNAIPFELEKAWIELEINKEDEEELENKQEELDKKLFWWKIKDNTEETILSYEYILEKYNNAKDKLNKEEQKRFQWYLNKIKPYLPKWYKYQLKEKPKSIDWDFLNIELPKKDYILWFNIFVEALEKLEHIVESNNEIWSISDGPKWVQFPTNEKFSHIQIDRFLLLWEHEIETHNITDYNWKQLLGNLRWSRSTEKDEWVAMLMEQLFKYWKGLYKIDEDWDQIIDIEKIRINSYFTKTLMWELLEDDDLLDFLKLSEKFDPDVITAQDRFDRLKRNNKRHVQHKDTTYTRWLFKAIKEINKFIKSKWKEWINPEDLFLGKISFDETKKLKKIKESKEKNWENIEIIKPLFISDAVYYAVTEKLKWESWTITWEWFYKYLSEKYPIFNFTEEHVKAVSYETKRNVYWIVNILKNIAENDIKNIWKQNPVFNTQMWNQILNVISNQYKNPIEKVRKKMHPDRKNAT